MRSTRPSCSNFGATCAQGQVPCVGVIEVGYTKKFDGYTLTVLKTN